MRSLSDCAKGASVQPHIISVFSPINMGPHPLLRANAFDRTTGILPASENDPRSHTKTLQTPKPPSQVPLQTFPLPHPKPAFFKGGATRRSPSKPEPFPNTEVLGHGSLPRFRDPTIRTPERPTPSPSSISNPVHLWATGHRLNFSHPLVPKRE
jgi:hypothetical protein